MSLTLKNKSALMYLPNKLPLAIKICCLPLALLVVSCSSPEKLIRGTSFNTKITQSGLKHFEVSLRGAPVDAEPKEGTPAPQRPKPRRGGRSEKQMLKIADIYLEENAFCRQGYWVMEVDVLRPIPRLRGECNDLASDEDRQRFPDTISRW